MFLRRRFGKRWGQLVHSQLINFIRQIREKLIGGESVLGGFGELCRLGGSRRLFWRFRFGLGRKDELVFLIEFNLRNRFGFRRGRTLRLRRQLFLAAFFNWNEFDRFFGSVRCNLRYRRSRWRFLGRCRIQRNVKFGNFAGRRAGRRWRNGGRLLGGSSLLQGGRQIGRAQ